MTFPGLFRADRLLESVASFGPILGLDTGGTSAGVSLASHGKIVSSTCRPVSSHCAALAPLVDQALQAAGLTLKDLVGVAVATGPGSFTGLRIGLSYAKGLAAALRCAIVGVPSLDAMAVALLDAFEPPPGALICPIIDARKGEVYGSLYRAVSGGVEKLSADFVLGPADLAARMSGEVIFFGDGLAAHGAQLAELMGSRAKISDNQPISPAVAVAALGSARIASNDSDQVSSLQPGYVRPADAALNLSRSSKTPTAMEALWSREKRSLSSNT